MDIAQVKREGEMQALWQHVHNRLWDAKRALEEASKTSGRDYKWFKGNVAKAEGAIADAKAAYAALGKMNRSK